MATYSDESLIRQLRELSSDSPQFPDQLTTLLAGERLWHDLSNFSARDAEWFVDYLDTILKTTDRCDSTLRSRCIPVLSRVCRTNSIIPSSYVLSNDTPTRRHPVASGSVVGIYDGIISSTGTKVCIKHYRSYDLSEAAAKAVAKRFSREAVVWSQLRHPNIVPLLGVTESPFQLVSEWMSGGEVQEYLKIRPDANRYALLLGVVRALGHLHSSGIVHGSLRGSNILVDDSGQPRISGFGNAIVALDALDPEYFGSFRGNYPIRWTAPEILSGISGINKETDIYAFGMVVYEIFAGTVPYAETTPATVLAKVLLGVHPTRPDNPLLIDKIWTLANRCWEKDPQGRPRITNILCDLQRVLVTKQDRVYAPNVAAGAKPSALVTTPTGSKCTPSAVFSKLRRHSEPGKTSPKSSRTSDCDYTIKSKESQHNFHYVELGYSHVRGGTSSRPRKMLRRATTWLFSCGFASSHDCQDGPPVLLAEETPHVVIGIDRCGVGSHGFGQLPVAGLPAHTLDDVASFRERDANFVANFEQIRG